MGSDELEAILNDILESAAFNDEFDDLQPMFSNCHIEDVWQKESDNSDDQSIIPGSATTIQKISSSFSSLSHPRYEINRELCFDRELIHDVEKSSLPSSISSVSLSSSSLSPASTNCSCIENVFDYSVIDLLNLRDQTTSKKRKIHDCCNDGKACKRERFESEKDFLEISPELSVLKWVTENTSHTSFADLKTVFQRVS